MLSEAFGESFIDAVRGIAPAIVGRTEGKEGWRPWAGSSTVALSSPGQREQWRPRGQTFGRWADAVRRAGVHRSNVGPHAQAEPVQSWRFVLLA